MTQRKALATGGVLLLAVSFDLATISAAEIAWGDAVKGLRVGVSTRDGSLPSEQRPMFTVVIQNVSRRPLWIPSPTAFVPAKHLRVDALFQRPLFPLIEAVLGNAPTYSSTGGQSLNSATQRVQKLAPGQRVELEGLLLDTHSYVVGHDDYRGKTTLTQYWLYPESRYSVRFEFKNENKEINGHRVWVGQSISGLVTVQVKKPDTRKFKISGWFRTAEEEYYIGEPIYALFEITNNGSEPLRFSTGGDHRSTGRHDRFTFEILDPSGKKLSDPVENGGVGGGLGGVHTVAAAEKYSEQVLVNLWGGFTQPGRYTIVAKRALEMVQKDAFVNHPGDPSIVIASTFTVVLREDRNALRGHLANLRQRLQQQPDFDEIRALALSRNPEAIPLLYEIALMKDGGVIQGRPYSATDWLKHYGQEKVAEVVTRIAAQSQSAQARTHASELAASWHLPSIDKLIRAQLKSPDEAVRRSAVQTCGRLVVAILSAGLAFTWVSGHPVHFRSLLIGGVLVGCGIAAMHYIGMAAMKMEPPIRYDPALFALSVLIAISASLAALWCAFNLASGSMSMRPTRWDPVPLSRRPGLSMNNMRPFALDRRMAAYPATRSSYLTSMRSSSGSLIGPLRSSTRGGSPNSAVQRLAGDCARRRGSGFGDKDGGLAGAADRGRWAAGDRV